MRLLVALLLIFILVAGCPQEEERYEYSVDSLSIEGREHIFSGEYDVFVKVSENSFNPENTLVLYQGGTRFAEQSLETPQDEIVFSWPADTVGDHELRAAIVGINGTEVSDSKALTVSVKPLGFYDLESDGLNHPVETGVWCAQEFTLENSATISEVGLHLRSLVPTPQEKLVSLEILGKTNGVPGNETLASSSILSTKVPSKADWNSFSFEKEIPAGTYWLVLKRDSSSGNIAWTYANGENANGAYCRDSAVSDEWFPIEGRFAFKVQ
jgi:hypothetical protein